MFKTINNEKGIALVLALMVLAALTLLGIAAITTSTLDISIAANEKTAVQAQYAAEAGIGETVGRLNLDSSDSNYITTPTTPSPPWPVQWANNNSANYTGWTYGFKKTISTTDGQSFFNYSVSMRFKPWVTGRAAFYNRTSGYTKSPFTTGGMPVYEITSVGSSGNYKSIVSLDITRTTYDYKIKGGLTSNGAIDVRGSPTLDGAQHKADGSAGQGSCSNPNLTGTKAAVYSNSSTEYHGGAGTVITPYTTKDAAFSVSTPWDALGITEQAFKDLFTNKQAISYTGARAGEMWIGGTGTVTSQSNGNEYNGTSQSVAGSGILVVHNPNFVPGQCASGNWNSTDPADGCYKEKAPAILNVSKDTFKGVIIADQASLSGNVTIIGSIISLTTIKTEATAAGNPTILYSCEAIEKYAGGKVKRKLAWNVIR